MVTLSVFFCLVLFASEVHAADETANVLDDILRRYQLPGKGHLGSSGYLWSSAWYGLSG
jgi:hypothetical protein